MRKPLARIVRDSRDATSDKFIPLADAQRLYREGKLYELRDIGQSYQPAYEVKP
jgi:hypothetical protein